MKKVSLFLMFFLSVGFMQAQNFYEGWETYNHRIELSNWTVVHKQTMRSSCGDNAKGWVINVSGQTILGTVVTPPTNGDTNKNLVTFACGGAPNKGTDSWLISPQIKNISNGDYLSFYLNNFTGSENNNLQVLISTTDANPESFTVLDSFPAYRSTSWTSYAYSLADYVGKNIYIAFRAYFFPKSTIEFGAVFGLDLIKVGAVNEYDMEIVEMWSPEVPMQNVDTSVNLTFVIKNRGHEVNTFDLWYIQSSKGSDYIYANNYKVNRNMKTLDTAHITFPKRVSFAKGSRDTIWAWVDVPGDLDHSNDTLPKTVVDNVSPAGIPYYNSFDSAADISGVRVFNIFRDESTWQDVQTVMYSRRGTGCMQYAGNTKYNANDWFFTKLIYFPDANKTYELSYWYGTSDASKPQKMTVAWAYQQKYQALMWELAWHENIVNQVGSDQSDLDRSYLKGTARFKVEKPGYYYIGFHCTSEASNAKLYVDDINIARAVDVPECSIDRSVSVYPNPAQDQFSISAAGTIKNVEVYNAVGQKVYQTTAADNQVDVNTQNFSNGLYIVRINTEKGFSTQKINVVR